MQTSPAVDGLAKRQMWELLEAALLEVHATLMQHVTMRCTFVEQSARRIRKVATRCLVGCNPMHCRLQHDKLCTALLSACALSCPCCGAAQSSPVGSSLRCGAGGGSCDGLRRRTSLLTESAARTGTRKRTHRGMARTCACASACGLQAEPRVLVGQRRSVDELSAVNALHKASLCVAAERTRLRR
jgi:hypothetical protein